MAMEYLFEYGFRPPGDTPYVTGAYVTGDQVSGIRNYDMSKQPAELLRRRLRPGRAGRCTPTARSGAPPTSRSARPSSQRYGAGTPAAAGALRRRAGRRPTRARATGAGSQLVFDSFLLQAPASSACSTCATTCSPPTCSASAAPTRTCCGTRSPSRGMGPDAVSGAADTDPVPSFASPYAENAEVTLRPLGRRAGRPVRLYVGDYEARAVPVADTDPATALPDTVRDRAGHAVPVPRGRPGLRAQAVHQARPGRPRPRTCRLTAAQPGVGRRRRHGHRRRRQPRPLIDDTEATNWASLDGVAGKQVTVDLRRRPRRSW